MNMLGHAQNQLEWCTGHRLMLGDDKQAQWTNELAEAKVAALIAQAESLAAIAEALQTPDSLFRSRQSDELRDFQQASPFPAS